MSQHQHTFRTTTPSGRPLCEECGFEQEEPAIAMIDDELVASMTEDAINAIALIVQKAIGQRDGGIAGVYFSEDENREAVKAIVQGLFDIEMIYARSDVSTHERLCSGGAN